MPDRLIHRTQAPYPDPDLAGGVRRTERFYYDGIRRIQEVLIDPVAAASMVDGDPELTLLAAASIGPELYEIDGLSAPAAFEAAQTGDDQEDPEPDPGPGNPGSPSPTVHTWLDREYVWGPGDRGVDELLIQFNASRAAMPILQDAGGDCIALCDFGGTAGAARVVAQFTYDPYGQVISHEHLVAQHAFLRAGHKGLFVDRLDAGVLTSGDESPRLVAGADLLAHNRNRTLKPDLGRFLQQDPNATGLVAIETAAFHGHSAGAYVGTFRLDGLYGDGANLYQALGSNPWMRSDPLGLSWMNALSAQTALSVLNFAEAKLAQLLVQHYAKMIIGSEIAAGIAMGDAHPGGSLWGAGASDAVQAMRRFAGGRFATNMLEEFSSSTFRTNALRLWGMEGNLFSSILKAHHIIPQADAVVRIMNRLGVGDMVHNPVFSALMSEADHKIIHAGSGSGGWYNRMWLAELNRIERLGVKGNDAANAIIDFIGREAYPKMQEALKRGGPPAGY